jgi:DNA mismatch endonuclease, patch repair protein
VRPPASSPEVRRRMQSVRRRDTLLEMRLRSVLHRTGFRYRVDRSPLPEVKRRADLVFPTERIAVFVDGCFWHVCPVHATWPKTNADWWREKLEANRTRDAATDAELQARGWTVVRIWGHESVQEAAERVADQVIRARAAARRTGRPVSGGRPTRGSGR